MPFPPSTNPPKASEKNCTICHKPLLVPTGDSEDPSSLIDDVEFRCGHHFHWSCIIEQSISSDNACSRCAICGQSALDSEGEFIVRVYNEEGFVSGYDFGSEIDQHLLYEANPEAERKMTFLSLMAQMEFSDAKLFLKGEDPGANEKLDPNVCYDGGGMTAMHMAALNDDVEGIQLLLKYGADKDFKSEDGETALDMAKGQNSKKVIALLTAEGSK